MDVWALVHRAQEGDAEAFGELYDHYVTMVHRYVYHRVGDRATAEDVTSETFVRALRRIDSLSFQGRDVGAWLVTIARNIVLDHVKSSRYRLEVTTADMRDADRATDGPEDAVVAHLTNHELLACVQQLGSEQQECIVLRFIHGLSVSETAAIMGKKDGAIKALQHRAVRRLAGMLPGRSAVTQKTLRRGRNRIRCVLVGSDAVGCDERRGTGGHGERRRHERAATAAGRRDRGAARPRAAPRRRARTRVPRRHAGPAGGDGRRPSPEPETHRGLRRLLAARGRRPRRPRCAAG